MSSLTPGSLYYGDCLDWMQRWDDESVDLIYLDPPFNSNTDYNILYGANGGGSAQYRAFTDTWSWDEAAADRYAMFESAVGRPAHRAIVGLHYALGPSGMLAYLTYMAERLEHMHRLLKPTGSLYLHCDPTMSYGLRLILDGIFEQENFRNEIIWRRTNAKGLASKRMASNHDVILGYAKTATASWRPQYVPHDPDYVRNFYRYVEPETGRRYRLDNLANPNKNRPNLTYEFLGVTRVWRWTKERMQKAYEDGLVVQTSRGRVPQFKRYLDEQKGRAIDDIWSDLPPVQAHAKERLGYPTQKPLALLERIISP